MDGVLTLHSPNGEELVAPAGVWLLAIYDLMRPEEQSLLFEKVKQMRDDLKWNVDPRKADLIQFNPLSQQLPLGRPSEVFVDERGKRHIRMFADTGHYFKEGSGLGKKVH